MPDKLTAQPEPEYGAKQEQQATAQANPMPKGDTKVDIKAPSAAQPMQQQAPAQQGNPLLRLPPEVLYANMTERPKTPVQRQADVGLFWEVLAATSNEPMIRAIASSILGRENV